jgi:hypothetical protein
MSLWRTVSGVWKNREETSEHAKLEELRTKYYKQSKTVMLDNVQKVLKQTFPNWRITHIDAERGELTIEKRWGLGVTDIVITVYSISPVRSAIDMVATRRGWLGDLGSTYRDIIQFFRALHKDVTPEL